MQIFIAASIIKTFLENSNVKHRDNIKYKYLCKFTPWQARMRYITYTVVNPVSIYPCTETYIYIYELKYANLINKENHMLNK